LSITPKTKAGGNYRRSSGTNGELDKAALEMRVGSIISRKELDRFWPQGVNGRELLKQKSNNHEPPEFYLRQNSEMCRSN
jgi:hypothetical protein